MSARPIVDEACGTTTSYRNGCRCQPCRGAHAESARQHRKTSHGRVSLKRREIKRRYGLTLESWSQMLRDQDSLCPICRCDISTSASVDHDHTTGRVRGLLCESCNKGIGFFHDQPERLRRAASYLD